MLGPLRTGRSRASRRSWGFGCWRETSGHVGRLVSNTEDVGAELVELGLESIVATVEMIDTADNRGSPSCQSGKYQGGAFPEGARFSLYQTDPMRGKAMAARFVNAKTLEACERFGKIASDCGLSLATFATAWTLSRDFVASTLIGATSVDQLDETLAAASVTWVIPVSPSAVASAPPPLGEK